MRSYLSSAGAQLLQNVFYAAIPPITITGSQVGSAVGFVPDDTMNQAQGDMLLDNQTNIGSVKSTLVHVHERIWTVILDETLEYDSIGNVLIFANNTPFLWTIADEGLPKVKTDEVAHFAGDKYYFPVVMRYPYVNNLITFDAANSLQAKFPVYNHIFEVNLPEHTPSCEQIFVESNDLYNGHNNPFFAAKRRSHWYAAPIMMPLDDTKKFGIIDGGTTKTGF